MRWTVLVLLVFASCGQIFGQAIKKSPVTENGTPKIYPLDGTPLLWKHYQQAANYLKTHPDMMEQLKVEKTTAWNFSVGSTHSWWVSNWVTEKYYQDASTCREVGVHCYIFVEDSLWAAGRVTQAAVDSIENVFDNMTPANPDRGIFEMDSLAFGAPPNVDGDPRIIILICNIQDGFTGSGGYIAGFFDPNQEIPTIPGATESNLAEIYYLDANPTNLKTASGLEVAMSTAAHEFQHMINYNYNKTHPQPTFVNESCSKLAEIYCGYPPSDQALYTNETNIYLFTWRSDSSELVLDDYARAQRLSLYLWDRFGIGIFKYIVQGTQTSGIGIMNDALSKYGTGLDFNGLFSDWLIANELNDTTLNRLYGYAYPNLPLSNGKNFYEPNESGTDTVQNLGAEYLIFRSGSNLNVTFTNTGGNSSLSVSAIEIGKGSRRVVSVPFNTPFTETGFGTTFSTIAFVVINENPNSPSIFDYHASGDAGSGVTELRWDTSEPVGYYELAALDTLCVTFDAVSHGVLDSVRVALRRAGSISGGVYQFTGVQRPSPLGTLLATISAEIYTTSTVPYPVPYQNWATIDLTSRKIAMDNPIAVAFAVGSNSAVPGVMFTDYLGGGPYHSYTYLSSSEAAPDPAGWYYIGTSDTTSIYLIRAYVSIVVDTVSSDSARIELSNFIAVVENETVTLSWQTTSEVNNAGFNVMRQDTGSSVKTIASYITDGSLKGLGTSSNGKLYHFTDGNVTSGVTYKYTLQSTSTKGISSDLGTLTVAVQSPAKYDLFQSYPNPVNPLSSIIKISYLVPTTGLVTLKVYDVLGREIATLLNEEKEPGKYEIKFDCSGMATGVYLYRMTAGSFAKAGKILIEK